MAGRIGDDELALRRGEGAVGHVDGDTLLALGCEAVDQQGEVDVLALRAHALRIGFKGGQLIVENQLGLEQQPADQGGLAIVHRAAGDEAQHVLGRLFSEVVGNVVGGQVERAHQK